MLFFKCCTDDLADFTSTCIRPLLFNNGTIQDVQISALDETDTFEANKTELENPVSYWKPVTTNKDKVWIQVRTYFGLVCC